jgi:hypothetical protein
MLAPLALGDARAIAKLMRRIGAAPPDDEAKAVLAAAAKAATLDPQVLEYAFQRISDDSYTQFLVQFAD